MTILLLLNMLGQAGYLLFMTLVLAHHLTTLRLSRTVFKLFEAVEPNPEPESKRTRSVLKLLKRGERQAHRVDTLLWYRNVSADIAVFAIPLFAVTYGLWFSWTVEGRLDLLWLDVIVILVAVHWWTIARSISNRDDRWKRLRRRAKDKVVELAGKLVVVPVAGPGKA